MLSCENVACIRGERLLFTQTGFCLPTGSLLVLSGSNGSGKSSLLRILAGLMSPSNGEVTWQGKPIRQHPDYREFMLYLGHENAIKPELSVYDNVQYWAALQDSDMLTPAALQFFGLLPIADMPAGQLSAGWQRRVALARLLATPSLIWLLDEPTTNLDAEGKRLLEGIIQTRIDQGGIVVMASHDIQPPATHRLELEDFMPQRTQEDEVMNAA